MPPPSSSSSTDQSEREALRKKLRQKIRDKRNGKSENPLMPQSGVGRGPMPPIDPQTLLLQAGIDDPDILAKSKDILEMTRSLTRKQAKSLIKSATQESYSDDEMPPPGPNAHNDSDSEEEPPPRILDRKDESDEEAPPPT